jgi:tetratricopeptide (TPR) repeat protein
MPLHPAASNSIAGSIANRSNLQFNLTVRSIGLEQNMATTNSWGFSPTTAPAAGLQWRVRPAFLRAVLLAVGALLFVGAGFCAEEPRRPIGSAAEGQTNFAAQAQRAFLEARGRYQDQPDDPDAAWQFGRACFDWAEFAATAAQRAEIAETGIAACRKFIAREPRSAPARYYLGMNLGQLARTKSLGALRIVDEMEREFRIVRTLDENFDFAGADRNLGLLYLEAPPIASIGNRSKARQHLQRAVELAPDYPENRLNLLEAYLRWNDRHGARRELQALEALWPNAKTRFAGDQWVLTWKDWDLRLAEARAKVQKMPRALESPRQKQ